MKSKKRIPTVQRLSFSKLSAGLRRNVQQLRRKRKYIIIEEKGIPIAGMMDFNEMEDYLELQDPELNKQIDEGYQEYLKGKTRPLGEFLDELKAKELRICSKISCKKGK